MPPNIDIDFEAIVRTFAVECSERISDMEQAVVALETQPHDQQFIETIFRGAHTLKGNAASLGFLSLAEFAHAMEDLLQRLRSGAILVTRQTVTLLLHSLDALREIVEEAIGGSDTLKPHHTALRNRLSDGASGNDDQIEDRVKNSQKPARPPGDRSLDPADRRREESAGTSEHSGTIRVDIGKLDRMLNLAGEIVIAQARLRQELSSAAFGKAAFEAHEQLQRLSLDLQEDIMKLRMVPVGTVFRHYVRVVRDVAAAVGKEARLAMEGEDAEIDLNLVEAIKDPLTHLVRNAIDHGIETPDIRRARGKDSCGLLLLRAFRDSGSMVIQLIDDGTGLNRERIIARAKEQGLITDTEKMSDHELYQLVFEPSFSTAHVVTDLSGRGMGMDIVRRNIEALRGSVHLESAPGKGVTVTMRLPLTLAIIEGFAVAAGGDTYILPLHAVRECLTLPAKERGKDAFGIIELRGEPLPCMRLRHFFAIPGTCTTRESVVVISADGITAAIVVDGLYGPRQTVVKPLGKHFQRVPGIAGSAILGNGRVALIVDVAGVLRDVMQSTAGDDHDGPGLSALEL